jgi:7-dehydrocholesterol reductase
VLYCRYASVSMYLVNQPVHLGPVLSSIILACGTASIIINYLADKQKQDVRRSNGKCTIWGKPPHILRAKYTLESGEQRESLLLVSGWWGISRHFHYVPELLLTLFWSLPALFSNILPYCYFLYLCILLTHRSVRDEAKCRLKYGAYWLQYCALVPYRMLPGLY